MSLDNRVALITGATGTLGRVVSKSLGSQGARLVLKGRNLDTLNEAAAQLDLPNDRILKCVFEASKKEDADEAFRLAKEKFGGVDILIH
ncbi:MAG: SDR family NAD(P)-dependent oxidoreductase, partial [Chloroflexi bacterium]|nr:SDR family NAD(P)-dependent oxidoreductase [Chloroflexota bacterium]